MRGTQEVGCVPLTVHAITFELSLLHCAGAADACCSSGAAPAVCCGTVQILARSHEQGLFFVSLYSLSQHKPGGVMLAASIGSTELCVAVYDTQFYGLTVAQFANSGHL